MESDAASEAREGEDESSGSAEDEFVTQAVASVVFAEEAIVDTWDEALGLMRDHQAEVGYLSTDHFNPDRERYCILEKGGFTRLYTMRAGGKLVGYAIFMVNSDLTYPSHVFATQAVLYVDPVFRGRPAVEFIGYQDDELEKSGCDDTLRYVSERNNYSRTLLRMGYASTGTTYLRRL